MLLEPKTTYKEAQFRSNFLKKEAELQLMFKSSKKVIQRLKTNKFPLPKLSFLKKTNFFQKKSDHQNSPDSAFSSLSTRCGSSPGEETFSFEEISKISGFESNLKQETIKLNDEDSVTIVAKAIKKRSKKEKIGLVKEERVKRRIQRLKRRRNRVVSRSSSRSKRVRVVRQDGN